MCHLLLVVVIRFASSFLRCPLCICGVFVRLCVYTFDIMLIVTNVSFGYNVGHWHCVICCHWIQCWLLAMCHFVVS